MAADFAYTITQTFEGYFIGVPMTLSVRNAEGMPDSRKSAVEAFIAEFTARNLQEDVDAELSKMASKFGHAYEMLYQDEDGMPRSIAVAPLTAFMVYDDSVLKRPLFFVRWFYGDDGAIKGSWSDAAQVVDFARTNDGFAFGEPSAHAFGSVPAVDFRQNTEGRGLYEGVLSLIEQYNAVLSEKANDVEYFSDCYMVVKGKELDESEIENIRENKIINLFGESTEGLDVMFLVKPNADGVQENLINRLETLIYKTAMVPDITDDNFATASGIALKMRMMPMSNLARNKELKFRRGVQERMRLLAAYPNADFAGGDWQAVEVTMHRNMPDDLQSEASVAGQLSGIVSEETQLSVLSCVSDPKAEMQRKRDEPGREGRRHKRRPCPPIGRLRPMTPKRKEPTMKVAIYSRGKRLAIREQPSAEAPIIGTMGSGCAAHVEDAAPGWLELTMGGYIREDLVTVGSLVDTTTYAIKEQPSGAPQPEAEQQQEAPAQEAEPEPAEEQPEADDNAGLMAMKINELRELAKGSGVALPKNATKAQIIELLMGSDE